MICPNCQKEIHPPQEVTHKQFTSSYYCTPCKERAIVWEGIEQGNKAYQCGRLRIHCDYKTNTAQVQRLYMDIESDTSIVYRWGTLLELSSIPANLSVDNIEEKIKLYLLFS